MNAHERLVEAAVAAAVGTRSPSESARAVVDALLAARRDVLLEAAGGMRYALVPWDAEYEGWRFPVESSTERPGT